MVIGLCIASFATLIYAFNMKMVLAYTILFLLSQ